MYEEEIKNQKSQIKLLKSDIMKVTEEVKGMHGI